MPVFIHNLVSYSNTPDDKILIAFLHDLIKNENYEIGDINLIYTDNSEILELNKTYLEHHYYTDVITFNYNEGRTIHGDVYISLDKVDENSKDYGTSLYNETLRVAIHGILHLAGYDDKTSEDQQKMREKENYYIEQFYLEK